MLMFPKSAVNNFRHTNKAKRWGQAFYDFMKLDKVEHPQDKEFCRRLYYAEDAKAKAMVQSRIDQHN